MEALELLGILEVSLSTRIRLAVHMALFMQQLLPFQAGRSGP